GPPAAPGARRAPAGPNWRPPWPRRRRPGSAPTPPCRQPPVRSRRPAGGWKRRRTGPASESSSWTSGVRRALVGGVRLKPSEALRFLVGLAAAVIVLGLIALRVTSCAPAPKPAPIPAPP